MYRELEYYQRSLQSYIEATYHISHPILVELRRTLLAAPGTVAQRPFIESTPRYGGSRSFSELAVPEAARAVLSLLGTAEGGRRLFDPPYDHQARALEATLGADLKDVVVTTGTGSGKTMTFLMPILGRLAAEAARSSTRFAQRGVRAVILYPMNALVNDQLATLRTLFGAPATIRWFTEQAGRPPKFARYTGRTLYPGVRTNEKNKHSKRLAS